MSRPDVGGLLADRWGNGPGLRVLGAAAIVALTFSGLVGLVDLSLGVPSLIHSLAVGDAVVDGRRLLAAANAVSAGGDPYAIDGFLYSPLAAWAMVPLTALAEPLALGAFLAIKLGFVIWFLADATRGWRATPRIVAGLLVCTWVFLLSDLWLGNVSVLLLCAMWLSISRDEFAAGIPLGIVLATIAKPLLIPFIAWMFIYRRRSLAGMILTAATLTTVAVIVLGTTPYVGYAEALLGAGQYAGPFPGNLGLSARWPGLLVPATVAVLSVFLALLWRSRDDTALLMWSLLAGLIASPYVGLYGPVPLLAGLFPYLRAHPSRALGLATVVAPLLFIDITLATLAGMVLTFPADAVTSRRPALRAGIASSGTHS